MKTLTTNATLNAESPLANLILQLSADAILNQDSISVPQIRQIEMKERLFYKIDEAVNNTNSVFGRNALDSAELRADMNETIKLRNCIGLKACDRILALNSMCKAVVGEYFLTKRYDVDNVKCKQRNVKVFHDLFSEYDDALYKAISEVRVLNA